MRTSDGKSTFSHPRYWPAWVGLGLLHVANKLDYADLLRLGAAMGEGMHRLCPVRAQVARVNLRICFPELTEEQREELVRENYRQMGIAALELGHNWYRDFDDFTIPYRLEGVEQVEAAQAAGRPVILLVPHFVHLETIGRILQQHLPGLSALYRPPNNPLFAHEMHRRRHAFVEAIPMNDVKRLIRTLREGKVVCYAPDQGRKIKDSALVPFFGEPAVTNTATPRLARMTHAAVLPVVAWRDADAQMVRVQIGDELAGMLQPDPVDGALAMNEMIEAAIRRAPAQYLWLHKRFKRRGEGHPDVYRS